MDAYVWLLPEKKQILVTDDPSPPVAGTFAGKFPLPDMGWGQAESFARDVCKRQGYTEVKFDRMVGFEDGGDLDDGQEEDDDEVYACSQCGSPNCGGTCIEEAVDFEIGGEG